MCLNGATLVSTTKGAGEGVGAAWAVPVGTGPTGDRVGSTCGMEGEEVAVASAPLVFFGSGCGLPGCVGPVVANGDSPFGKIALGVTIGASSSLAASWHPPMAAKKTTAATASPKIKGVFLLQFLMFLYWRGSKYTAGSTRYKALVVF